jgi:hypothetical protein
MTGETNTTRISNNRKYLDPLGLYANITRKPG